MKLYSKNQKPTLLKSTIFTVVVAAAVLMIMMNILLVAGMYIVMVSPKYDIYSRFTIACMSFFTVLNVVCITLLLILRKTYERRIMKKIVLPLREIEHHITDFVHGDYNKAVEYEYDDEIGDLFKAVDSVRLQLSEYRLIKQQAEAQKQIQVSGLIHDIATPVTRINGCASLINDGFVTDYEDIKRFSALILQSTEDINLMLKSLSRLEKYNRTDIQLQLQPIDIGEVLKRYIADLNLEMGPKNIGIGFENKCKAPAVTNIDVKSCKRALHNFINNSVKYKKSEEDCRINITLEDTPDGGILFSFADNGIGIEPGSEKMIFEMFYRGDIARRNISDGNGLGLFLSRQILLSNNAEVWAENNGNGLTVFVLFRRADIKPVKWYK